MVPDSTFLPWVEDSIGALQRKHQKLLDRKVRDACADSLDLDQAASKGRENEPRWDYLLGFKQSTNIIGIEPHEAAKTGAVKKVIEKRKAALRHLKGNLKDGKKIHKWLWVAPKKVHIAGMERQRFLLDQNGIKLVGKLVKSEHIR